MQQLLTELQPKVLDWYDWYERKLSNQSYRCSFGYRERTSNLNEQSSLDDYPRAVNVHDRAEIHLDLQSQMIEFALTLQQYSAIMQGADSAWALEFGEKARCLATTLQEALLNESLGRYADYVNL